MRVEVEREESTALRRLRIAKRAAENFSKLVLTKEGKHTWYCRPPNGFHWFRVTLIPGYVIIAGDIGELMLRVQEDELGLLSWLKGQFGPEPLKPLPEGVERPPEDPWLGVDYVLGKRVEAWKSDNCFMVQEVDAVLKAMRKEGSRATAVKIQGDWDPDSLEDHELENEWHRAYNDHVDCDVPDCTDFGLHSLQAFQALRHFVRLLLVEEEKAALLKRESDRAARGAKAQGQGI